MGRPRPVREVMVLLGSTPLIAMPLDASNPEKNYGTGGDFTANSAPYVGARGASEFIARSAYVGSASELYKSGNIGDDSKKITAVIAYNGIDTTANVNIAFRFTHPNGNGINIAINSAQTSGNTYGARFTNSSGTAIFDVDATSPVPSKNEWNIFLLSIDLGNSKEHLFMNNVSMTPTSNIFVDDNIGLSSTTDCYVAKTLTSTAMYGFIYFTTDYIDFSQEENRNLFVDQLGYPKDLKAQIDKGLIPEPLVYLPFDDTDNLGKNLGTGGDFTINGSVLPGMDYQV